MPGARSKAELLEEQAERAEKKASLAVLAIGVLALLFVGGGAIILGIVNSAMKGSDVFKEAVARAAANPKVTGDLGSPLDTGYLPSGNIEVSGDSGRAALRIDLTGPKGEGTLDVLATKSGGRWAYQKLYFISASGRGVDLK